MSRWAGAYVMIRYVWHFRPIIDKLKLSRLALLDYRMGTIIPRENFDVRQYIHDATNGR